jgi:hypothetical protein
LPNQFRIAAASLPSAEHHPLNVIFEVFSALLPQLMVIKQEFLDSGGIQGYLLMDAGLVLLLLLVGPLHTRLQLLWISNRVHIRTYTLLEWHHKDILLSSAAVCFDSGAASIAPSCIKIRSLQVRRFFELDKRWRHAHDQSDR